MTQYIVVRRDLNLSLGKLISQCVHASSINTSKLEGYYSDKPPRVVTLYVKSEAKMLKIIDECQKQRIPIGAQYDSGINEVDHNTLTVLSIGPTDIDTSKILKRVQAVTGGCDFSFKSANDTINKEVGEIFKRNPAL